MSYDNPPPPPPPGQYGAPVPGAAPENSGKALASMITGLVGLLTICCGLFVVSSIVALVLGLIARREIAASGGRLKGDGQAMTGIVTGAIGIALLIVSIILIATGVVDTNFDYSTS
jgi:hypothetical protein